MQALEIRHCSPAEGVRWFTAAWALFSAEPVGWIIICLLFFSLGFVLGLVPLLGGLVLMLINPALVGGLLYSAKEQDEGRRIMVWQLFQAFRDDTRRRPMLVLGLVNLLLSLLALLLGMLVVGSVLGIEHMSDGMPPFDIRLTTGLFAGLILFITVPLLMAMLFLYAIPLVMFEATPALEAMKLSLRAGLANVWPLSLLGLIFVPLWLFGVLSFGLGFLLVIPLLFISIYTSYKRIFKPRFSIEELV